MTSYRLGRIALRKENIKTVLSNNNFNRCPFKRSKNTYSYEIFLYVLVTATLLLSNIYNSIVPRLIHSVSTTFRLFLTERKRFVRLINFVDLITKPSIKRYRVHIRE